MTAKRVARGLGFAAVVALVPALSGCKQQNKYVPPPQPTVQVAPPVSQAVTHYLELNGTVQAVNTVDLVARVSGFLQDIGYTDGATVKKGTALFTIDPPPYYAKMQQAQSQVDAAQAQLKHAKQEYARQSTLGADQYASQSKVDDTIANRDTSAANLDDMKANLQLAAINYSYTRVLAPFDGIVTAHLKSVGELVGGDTPTKLATIIQLEPIYVTFNVAEQDVLRIRKSLADRGIKITQLDKIPVDVGLANEQGFPHHGVLNYVAPNVDPSTGTLEARAIFQNQDHALLPGYFARVRVPIQRGVESLLVPDTALGADQGGQYVLVVNDQNVVEQRYVQTGPLDGSMRVIASGLKPSDRVVVGGMQAAIPGSKVQAVVRTADASR